MGLLDIFKGKSWEEENAFTGETPPCPECGEPMRKKYIFSDTCCENANCSNFYGLDNGDDDDDDGLNEHPYIYCCGIQHDSTEIACRSCGDYF